MFIAQKAAESFTSFFTNIGESTDNFKNSVGGWFDNVGTWLTDLGTNITSFFAGIPEFFANFGDNLKNALVSIYTPEERLLRTCYR